ncbi:MAG TPA: MBL fold metallo-hydrolase [Methanotrichaceae archaeon]|nr:MBL fold metallo-hydrolase [Methanotrichaceae archaeon]
MEISWFGHSCFCLHGEGITIVTDPYDQSVGYEMPRASADVVLVSHEHDDHNNVSAIQGSPVIIRGPGEHHARGMKFLGVETCHDSEGGRLMGMNTAFCFDLEGIRICHLGDLGDVLTKKEAGEIGPVDLLFVPVGGTYTLDARGADRVLGQLRPALAVPMHYHTQALTFDLNPVDEFLKGRKVTGPEKTATIRKESLPSAGTEVLLLDYRSA